MPNNLFAGVPAVVVAKESISFADAGFTASNTEIIYEVGNPLKSWVPGRAINSVTGFTLGLGYYVVPAEDMDKSDFLYPPLENQIFWDEDAVFFDDEELFFD